MFINKYRSCRLLYFLRRTEIFSFKQIYGIKTAENLCNDCQRCRILQWNSTQHLKCKSFPFFQCIGATLTVRDIPYHNIRIYNLLSGRCIAAFVYFI